MTKDNVVHFKTAKKRAGYAEKEAEASENRVKFGRTKVEKRIDSFDKNKAKTDLNARKLDHD